MSVFDPSFSALRRSLGLTDAPNFVDLGLNEAQVDDYDSNQSTWQGLARMFASRASRGQAGMDRMLTRRSGDILSQYAGLVPLDPTLRVTDYYAALSPEKYRKTLSWDERGENPGRYTRGYRTLGS